MLGRQCRGEVPCAGRPGAPSARLGQTLLHGVADAHGSSAGSHEAPIGDARLVSSGEKGQRRRGAPRGAQARENRRGIGRQVTESGRYSLERRAPMRRCGHRSLSAPPRGSFLRRASRRFGGLWPLVGLQLCRCPSLFRDTLLRIQVLFCPRRWPYAPSESFKRRRCVRIFFLTGRDWSSASCSDRGAVGPCRGQHCRGAMRGAFWAITRLILDIRRRLRPRFV